MTDPTPEPPGCPTPGACSALKALAERDARIAELEGIIRSQCCCMPDEGHVPNCPLLEMEALDA